MHTSTLLSKHNTIACFRLTLIHAICVYCHILFCQHVQTPASQPTKDVRAAESVRAIQKCVPSQPHLAVPSHPRSSRRARSVWHIQPDCGVVRMYVHTNTSTHTHAHAHTQTHTGACSHTRTLSMSSVLAWMSNSPRYSLRLVPFKPFFQT